MLFQLHLARLAHFLSSFLTKYMQASSKNPEKVNYTYATTIYILQPRTEM